MKRVVAFFKLPELYCALLLVACVVTGVAMRVSIDNVVLTRDGDPEKVSFPVAQKMADGELFRAKVAGGNKVAMAKEEKMVPKTSHFTQDQLQRLAKLAKREGVGEAILLREALDLLLKKYDI